MFTEVSTYAIILQQAKLGTLVVIEFSWYYLPFSFQSLCSPGRFSDVLPAVQKQRLAPLYFSLTSTPLA